MGQYDLWSGREIYNTLVSLQTTMLEASIASSSTPSQALGKYQEGYVAALRAVALSFGLRPPSQRVSLAAIDRSLIEK